LKNKKTYTKHLDLGCGNKPKNPYNQEKLYGLDLNSKNIKNENVVEIKKANLAFEKIPYKNNSFDSVSAFDFLEHIPRITSSKGQATHYAFVELMNEIFRVLKHQGRFYAVTPAYPHPSAFVDPTHVNFITDKTHYYFCTPSLGARMYGFNGSFKIIRIKRVRPKYLFEPTKLNLTQKLRKLNDKLKGLESHLVWELEAVKI
jgi:SAM-dependent methyltransferase